MSLPRVLFVGPTRYSLPLPPGLQHKWDAIGRRLDVHVLARRDPTGRDGADPRFELVDGSFYASLPWLARGAIRSFRPDAIVAEDLRTATLVMSGRALAGAKVPVIAEVHGNWRHSTRLYGSRARRVASPLVDALDDYAVRHADAVRALSPYTAGLVEAARGRPPDAVFPTYSDLTAFTSQPVQPIPERPSALFVGVLEPYKNVDLLARAWRRVAAEVPGAKLVVIGRGSRQEEIDRLVLDRLATHVRELPPDQVARTLDAATVLVLPSRHEGLGRVVIEAFARGRGVVASRAGGILDLVDDGEQGLLVDPDEGDELADALVRVLSDRPLAERLGEAALRRFPAWNQTPWLFATRLRALVDTVLN
jgi:glycosyltransferase involved in cell wall biosynthesis